MALNNYNVNVNMLNGPKFSQDIFKLQIITFRLDLFEIATSQTSTQYN